MAEKVRYGIFKVMVDCTHCGNPVVVNGPLSNPRCPSCLEQVAVPPGVWSSIIGDYLESYSGYAPGSGSEGTVFSGGITAKYSAIRLPPPDPACPDCEENWDLVSVGDGDDGMLSCRKCGRKTPVFPPPEWLVKEVPRAVEVFFGERDVAVKEEEPGEMRPVALTCPQCGGALVVDGESERTVPCRYCNVDVYLPDAVWLKLHPAKQAKYWMVRFRGPFGKSED